MGGTMRGGNGHIHTAHNGRRRWNVYVSMVIIAIVFGCGLLLGVMGLHRLKDRRILNLLIKEKDEQIRSLHLLLQKEKDHNQEAKRKTEEMKIKLYNLRAQKTELNAKISDMQSTISSLKDEQRTIESQFQEKQNEAELLRQRYIQVKDLQNPQVISLTEMLRQKEAEIEDLKRHLQLCANAESLSKNESSIVAANITAKENVSGSEATINQSQGENGDVRSEEGRNLEDIVESNGNNKSSINRETEISLQSRTNVDTISEQVEPKGNENNEVETGMIDDLGNEEHTPRDRDSEANFTESRTSKSSEDQDLGVHKGGVKLEVQDNFNGERFRFREKHRYLKRAMAKRNLGSNAKESGKKIEQGKPRNQDEKVEDSIMGSRMQNESILKSQQFGAYDKLSDDSQINSKATVKGYNGENMEDGPPGIILGNTTTPVDNESTSIKVVKFDMSKNDEKRINYLGRIEVGEANEDVDDVQVEDLAESELRTSTSRRSERGKGEESEDDEEQRDEPEF